MDNMPLINDFKLYLADLIEEGKLQKKAGYMLFLSSQLLAQINLESLLERYAISRTTILDNVELPSVKQSEQMEIIEPHDDSLWIRAIIEGRCVNAFVFK